MAVSTNYRLPGVYSREVVGPRYSTTGTNRPVIAFIGPSVGYMSASQRVTLTGVTPFTIPNDGVIASSVTMTGTGTRKTYSNGTDFVVDDSDVSGETTVARNVITPSPATGAVTAVLSVSYERSYAPNTSGIFDFHDDQGYSDLFSGNTALDSAYRNGWAVQGTFSAEFKADGQSEFASLTSGTDYVFDYRTSSFTAVTSAIDSTPPLASQGTLRLSFKLTLLEPVMFNGEAPWKLIHSEYVEPVATVDGVEAYGVDVYGFTVSGGSVTPVTYSEGADYSVNYSTGRVVRVIGSSIPTEGQDSTYYYCHYSYCGIEDGTTVIVSYDYSGASYYEPVWVSGYNVAQETFGRAFDQSTGALISPLTAAVYIASKNGLGGCWCVAVEGYDNNGTTEYPQSSWDAAVEALKSTNNVDIIVPLTGDTGVWSSVQDAVNVLCSDEYQDECVAIVGPDGTSATIGVSDLEAMAVGLNSELMWMVAPSTFQFRNPVTNVVDIMPAYYMAAAIAGYLASVPAYTPLTHKVMSGFWGRNERHTKADKTRLSGSGMLYVDEYNGSLRILHGRTTAQNGVILDEETNIVLAKHIIIKVMRDLYSSGYIGSVINQDTLMMVKSSAQSTLSTLLRAGYMSEVTYISVEQDDVVQTQINVSFEYRPSYSLNYIEITFSVDATTSAA